MLLKIKEPRRLFFADGGAVCVKFGVASNGIITCADRGCDDLLI